MAEIFETSEFLHKDDEKAMTVPQCFFGNSQT